MPAAPSPSYRRRPQTRTSGHKVGGKTSGGDVRIERVPVRRVGPDAPLKVSFQVKGPPAGSWVGFGAWYWASRTPAVRLVPEEVGLCLTEAGAPVYWAKVGSLYRSDGRDFFAEVTFEAATTGEVALWSPICGVVTDPLIVKAPERLLGNMYQYAPEAVLNPADGSIFVEGGLPPKEGAVSSSQLHLKGCNRCSRFLPVNYPHETRTLSFSNHCTAKKCVHSTFGLLRFPDQTTVKLQHGFQLECRYCKKFTVNAAHNPQRSSGQMKEDGARRRAFELLLTELSGTSPILAYHEKYGRELVDDVWERFGGKCFNRGEVLPSKQQMHLDHTRPLALLWPLDESATALCASCNSEKHDKSPGEFYTREQLEALSKVVGLPLDQLEDPSPNIPAVRALLSRLDWFFSTFLARPDFTREREGKRTDVLIVKAIQKVLDQCPEDLLPEKRNFDLVAEFRRRHPELETSAFS
jgi:hypothetical protein